MDVLILVTVFFNLINAIKGIDNNCYLDGYHQCDGYNKCCFVTHVCAGTDTCFPISAIVVLSLGALGGIITLVVVICLCTKQKKGTVGTVFSQDTGGTSNDGRQQGGQLSLVDGQQTLYHPSGNFPPPPSYEQSVPPAAQYK